jgi:hypothetical protein
MKLLTMQCPPVSITSFLSGPNVFPQHPVLEYPQSVFIPQHDKQVSHPWQATGKFIVLFYTLIMRTGEY